MRMTDEIIAHLKIRPYFILHKHMDMKKVNLKGIIISII